MNEKEMGYFAGIVDGEGTLGLGADKRNGKIRGYAPYLAIPNTSKEILEKVVEIAGTGKIRTRKEAEGNHKKQHVVTFKSNALRKILPLIKDMLCKKKQAELLLEALDLNERSNIKYKDSNRFQRLSEIYDEMKVLNKRGRDNSLRSLPTINVENGEFFI